MLLQYGITFTQYYANLKRSCNPTNILTLCVAVAATPKPIHIGILIPPTGANSTARNVTTEQQVRKTHTCARVPMCMYACIHTYIHTWLFLKYVHFKLSSYPSNRFTIHHAEARRIARIRRKLTVCVKMVGSDTSKSLVLTLH